MKKLFLVMVVAFLGICSANAQKNWYAGGSLLIRTYSNAEDYQVSSKFNLSPEVGYKINKTWAVGLRIGFGANNVKEGDGSSTFNFNPYARWTILNVGKLNLFGDCGFDYSSSGVSNNKLSTYSFGIEPGISYDLNDKFALIARSGFLGYRGGDNKSVNGLELSFTNNFSFGIFFKF